MFVIVIVTGVNAVLPPPSSVDAVHPVKTVVNTFDGIVVKSFLGKTPYVKPVDCHPSEEGKLFEVTISFSDNGVCVTLVISELSA